MSTKIGLENKDLGLEDGLSTETVEKAERSKTAMDFKGLGDASKEPSNFTIRYRGNRHRP
ncbi:MAG: hypothetical protein GY861_29120 [bacterium]|nr:hypothetical protein [bacterium]